MKGAITAYLALLALACSPALAETWVHAATARFTYDTDKNGSFSKNTQIVHHVDTESVAESNGLRYFNRKITLYTLEGEEWLQRWERVTENNNRADCRNHTLMISPADRDGIWQYRQSDGEWWTQREIDRGSRVTGISTELLNLLGYNTHAERVAAHDSTMSGFYRLVCEN